ncbi:MAG: hypothetical protein Q7R53_01345 [bacterium]|nr:hypothetical protein [bacterium]
MKEMDMAQESWDKKKIIFAITIILFILAGGFILKNLLLGKGESLNLNPKNFSLESVKGLSTKKEEPVKENKENSISLPSASSLQTNLQQKIDSIKQEVNSLKIEDVASSSPQIQKIVDDIKSLESYPKNQAKEMCQKVCNSF